MTNSVKKTSFAVETDIESSHWWYVGRCRLIATVIRQIGTPRDAPVLDVGSGTGATLRVLKELGFRNVFGVDNSETSARYCAERGLPLVLRGDICSLPFRGGQFELVLATDVIEHVDDDIKALSELQRVLANAGTLVLTVPAFEVLWGLQDEVSRHKRRYRLRQLQEKVTRTGLICSEVFHFNYLLFVPVWIARKLIQILRVQLASENEVNTPFLNRFLTAVFRLDVKSARFARMPFGVSILLVAQKK